MLCLTIVKFVTLFIMVCETVGEHDEGLEPPVNKPHYKLADAPRLFEKFIKDYNRNYKDEADKHVHYEEFVKTLKTVNELNSDPRQGTAMFDINDFADYTEEQLKYMRGARAPKDVVID